MSTFAWLAQRGVDWHTLKYAEISASASLAAMEQGRVVGSAIYEPALSAFLATGKIRVIGYPFDGYATHFTEAVLFGNVTWVNAHRDLVDRFLRVMSDAGAYVGSHEAEVQPILAQFAGTDPSVQTKVNHPGRRVALSNDDIQPVIDALAKYNVIPKAFPAQDLICTCAPHRP